MSLERDAANHFGVCPGSGRSGGGIKVWNRGGRGRERRVIYLPWWSLSPIRCPRGIRSRVAVRGKRRHDALALSSAARGFITVARLTRFDGESLADESNSTRRLRGRLLRVFLMFSENQRG